MQREISPPRARVFCMSEQRYLENDEVGFFGDRIIRFTGSPDASGMVEPGEEIDVSSYQGLDESDVVEPYMGRPDRDGEHVYAGDVLLMPDGRLVAMEAEPLPQFRPLDGSTMPFNESAILQGKRIGHVSQSLEALQAEADDELGSAGPRE